LKEARRVLKPGGKLVVVIWDKPEMSDGTEILKAISTLLPPPPPGTPGPFALSEDGKVEGVFQRIGMKKISRTKVACPFLYHSLNNAVKSFMGTGPAAAALNQNPGAVVEGVIADAFEKFGLVDDMYFVMNSFLLFVGQK
jgi:ubiquinone/menaquinone biosynthesis C-methylase UbiE